MNLTNTLLTVGLASGMMLLTACRGNDTSANPLLEDSTLPYGAPDFSRIKTADYLPAIRTAIAEKRENIQKIVDNPEPATFENTIVAFEESGVRLERIVNVLYALASADKTPEIAEAEKEATPLLTDLDNELMFNKQLFERIKTVYDAVQSSMVNGQSSMVNGPEDLKLLDETYKRFVRAGALLSDEDAERMKQINLRIADLQQQWGDALQAATNDAAVWVSSVEELAGLSEADIAQCKEDAESRGGKAPYCIVIVNTTQQAILASLDNRDLRRRVYEASIHRADGTGQHNTFAICTEIARLRAEQAKIMGYQNYAEYSLENTMAKTPDAVYSFLRQLISDYTPKADAETRAIEEYARRTDPQIFNNQSSMVNGQSSMVNKLEPYDRFYYSAKMKKELLQISDDEVKP